MSNIFLLTKNYFRIFLSRLAKLVSKKSKATTSVAMIAIIFGGIFIFAFATISYSTIVISLESGVPELALYSFSTTLLMFTFMLIVTESSSNNKTTDEEILLSLPFKKSEIVASKIIYFCLFDFIILIGLIFPSYIIYYVMVESTSIFFLIRAFLVILLSTLFSTAISGIISTLLNKMTKRFRYSNIIRSLISMVLIVTFAIAYLGFTFISQNANYAGKLYDFYPIKMLTLAICDSNVASLIILTIICLVSFIVSIIIKSYFYGRNATSYRSKNQTLNYNESSIEKSLYKREMGKFFSIPIYVTNTAFGPVFVIIIAILISFVGKDFFLNIIEIIIATGYENLQAPTEIMVTIGSYFTFGIIMLLSLTLSLAPTTSCCISLENKELWILKAHPISYKDVFKSKLMVNITITTIPLTIASLLLSISLGIKYLPFIFIIPFLIIIMTSIIGLYVNLLYPKFGWESEQEVIKQGMSVLVTMLINMICVIIPALLYFIIPVQSEFLCLTIVAAAYLLLILIWQTILFKNGKKLYEKL